MKKSSKYATTASIALAVALYLICLVSVRTAGGPFSFEAVIPNWLGITPTIVVDGAILVAGLISTGFFSLASGARANEAHEAQHGPEQVPEVRLASAA